jgi:hypothetical protein
MDLMKFHCISCRRPAYHLRWKSGHRSEAALRQTVRQAGLLRPVTRYARSIVDGRSVPRRDHRCLYAVSLKWLASVLMLVFTQEGGDDGGPPSRPRPDEYRPQPIAPQAALERPRTAYQREPAGRADGDVAG